MDAVFVRDSGSLFPKESVKKSFYCPTPSKQPTTSSKKKAGVMLSPLTPPHLTPPPFTPHSSDMHWDLKLSPSLPTTSNDSGDSSKFNESWPSCSDGPSTITHPATNQRTHKDESLQSESSHSKTPEIHGGKAQTGSSSTLSRYIERFRQAPPTARGVRNKPMTSFWWKEAEKGHALSPQDQSTPNSNTSSRKSRSFTNPSPHVSSQDTSLEERSREAIDKSLSLISSNDSSLPAQKYLNSNNKSDLMNIQQPSPAPPPLTADPSEDILYLWRVKRRLEIARKEAGLGSMIDRTGLRTKKEGVGLVGREVRAVVPPHRHWSCDVLPCSCDPECGGVMSHVHTGGQRSEALRERQGWTETPKVKVQSPVQTRPIELQNTSEEMVPMEMETRVQSTNKDTTQMTELEVKSKGGTQDRREVGIQSVLLADNGGPSTPKPKLPGKGLPSPKATNSSPKVGGASCHGIQVLDTSDEDDLSLTLISEPQESPRQPPSTPNSRPAGQNIGPLLSQVVEEHLFKPHPPGTPTSESRGISPPISPRPSNLDIPWDDHLDDDLLKTLISKAKLFEEQIREIDLLLSAMTLSD